MKRRVDMLSGGKNSRVRLWSREAEKKALVFAASFLKMELAGVGRLRCLTIVRPRKLTTHNHENTADTM